jgi:predicted nucleotidyltransferase
MIDDAQLGLIREWLANEYGVDNLLFATIVGSHVYGTADATSDVDLYVVLRHKAVPTPDADDATVTAVTAVTAVIVDADKAVAVECPQLPGAWEVPDICADLEGVGKLDGSTRDEDEFLQELSACVPKALEAVSIPPRFHLYGDDAAVAAYRAHMVRALHPPTTLRHTYGKLCRNAKNRCNKKLTRESTASEHWLGKKSFFHAVRNLVLACQLATHQRIDWDAKEVTDITQFFLATRDQPVTEWLDDATGSSGSSSSSGSSKSSNKDKLCLKFEAMYKAHNKTFKQLVPNEEQWMQLEKKKVKQLNKTSKLDKLDKLN